MVSFKAFREFNVISKRGSPRSIKVAIAYPSTYTAAISSLIIHILYFLLNSYREVIAERVFLEYPRNSGLEKYRSIESRRSLRNFNIILFSVHYEPDYVNIVDMIISSKIPLNWWDRDEKDPLILIGGPPVTANPEPLANIADALIIGEAENLIDKIIKAYISSMSRRDFLDIISSFKGVYVPKHGKYSIRKNYVENLDEAFYPVAQIQPLTVEPAYGKGIIVETTRGCKWHCQFCMEGFISKPRRDRSFNKIKKIILRGIEINNVRKVIFYALSFFDHDQADKILEFTVNDLKIQASIPSLRPSTLNKYRLKLMVKAGQRTLTIAPESLCENIGVAIKKFSPQDRVTKLIADSLSVGISNIKMYFIVGFPGQGFEEVKKIVEYVKKVVREFKLVNPRQIRITINPLIPKPQTPLQWLPLENLEILNSKINYLAKQLQSYVVDVNYYNPKWAKIQATIALGDRNIEEILKRWFIYGKTLGTWKRALREAKANVKYVEEGRELEEELPWDHVDIGFPKEYFRKSFEFYMKFIKKPCSSLLKRNSASY